MKTSRMILILFALVGGFTLMISGAESPAPSAAGSDKAQPLVNEKFPGLATGSLTFARLSVLPAEVILKTDGLAITEKEIGDEVAKTPPEVQEQLKKNKFFLLENMATAKLLVMLAKTEAAKQNQDVASLNEKDLIQNYLKVVVASVQVTDPEISDFYEKNKDMCGGAGLDQVKDQLKQYVLQQKQQEIVDQHVRTLGERIPVEVAAVWTKEQAELAKDNPVDKARASGKPSLVDFGASGCRPCDMMTPILTTLKEKYAGKLNVLFVHVRQEQILAGRYGIQSIPVQMFYDKDGKEVFRHTGFFPQPEIEKKLVEIGIK
jgi:thiol-disulfide isomerase/thioredoxin